MATQAKIEQVAELAEKIRKAQSVVLVDYQGITVNEETELRKKVREAGAEYLVAKNMTAMEDAIPKLLYLKAVSMV